MKILPSIFTFILIISSYLNADEFATTQSLDGHGKIAITSFIRKNEIITIKGTINCKNIPCGEKSFLNNSYLLDEYAGVKYLPIIDSRESLLASRIHIKYLENKTERFWLKLTAPPEEVNTIDLYFEKHEPIEGLIIVDE